MDVYIALFFIVYIMSFFEVFFCNKSHKIYLAIIILFISAFFGGLRHEIGTDWEQYYFYFYNNDALDEFMASPYEYGYVILNYILKFMVGKYNVLLVIMIGLICSLKLKTIYKYACFPLVVMFLNFSFYIGDFFAVRQSIALAIVVYSIRYIIEHDFKKFFIVIGVACLFHKTAIVFFPAYWIFHFKISTRSVLSIAFCMALMTFYFSQINLFSLLENIDIDNAYIGKVVFYQYMAEQGESFGTTFDNEEKILNSIIKKTCFLLLFLLMKKKVEKYDVNYNGFLNLSIFSNILFLFFLPIPEISLRLVSYYNYFEIFLLSDLLFLSNKWVLRVFIIFGLGIIGFLRYFYGIYQFYDLFIPYKNILFIGAG